MHTTTRMTTFEASNDKSMSSLIPSNNTAKLASHKKFPKFQNGDLVRVPEKRTFIQKVIQQFGKGNFLKYIKIIKRIQ